MRSGIRPPELRYGEWKPWFAWYPVRVIIGDTSDAKHYAMWQWVWWEPVEWREASWVDVFYNKYRLPGDTRVP